LLSITVQSAKENSLQYLLQCSEKRREEKRRGFGLRHNEIFAENNPTIVTLSCLASYYATHLSDKENKPFLMGNSKDDICSM
jgi:hypothetical protein